MALLCSSGRTESSLRTAAGLSCWHRAHVREGLWVEGQGGWRLHPCSSCCRDKSPWLIIPASSNVYHTLSPQPPDTWACRCNTPTSPGQASVNAQTPLPRRAAAPPPSLSSQNSGITGTQDSRICTLSPVPPAPTHCGLTCPGRLSSVPVPAPPQPPTATQSLRAELLAGGQLSLMPAGSPM